MSVFRDESGRRGKAVRLASVLGAVVAAASLGAFLVSVFPAPWTRKPAVEEPAPQQRAATPLPLLGTPGPAQAAAQRAQEKARELAYKREADRLKALLGRAEAAQHRRKPDAPAEPVLAAFAVNWDPASVQSLASHADQLTHVMPEWIHVLPDGQLAVEEDPGGRIRQLSARLELVPTVSNYGSGGFSAALARPILATEALRRGAAERLAQLCAERGYAGINLDLESLGEREWREVALFAEVAYARLHKDGFLFTIDVPGDPKGIPVEKLAANTDFLVLMAYDEHAASDEPGPIATPRGVQESAAAYLARAPADKLVVALGAYGYDWPLDAEGDAARPAEELSYEQALVLARENEVPIEWDPEAKSSFFEYDDDDAHEKHSVRFLDAPAALAELQALRNFHLRGSAVWRLGAEDPKLFELFTHPPLPRAFDESGARGRLDGLIDHGADDVQLAGDGELITLKAAPQAGRRAVLFAPDGSLAKVEYQQYPSGWILERRGGKPHGKVALTFDDGPDPKWTGPILDALAKGGVHGAFFLIGENAQANQALVRREFAEGHFIGNHSFSHPDLAKVSPLRLELELNVTERLLEWLTGAHPRLFRPPYHSDESLDEPANAQVIARASALGYLTLGQDIDPEDFAQRDPKVIVDRVMAKAKDGSVILLHDGGGDRSATLAAIPLILDGLRARGLQVVDPDEVVGSSRAELLPPAPREHGGAFMAGADSLVFGLLGSASHLLGPAFGFAIAMLALRGILLALFAPLQARRSRRARADERALEAAGKLPPLPPISVVVPGYNEETVMCRTVDSLLAQEPPVLEVVCVDDGSTDRTLEVLRAAYPNHPRVRILTKPNGGKSSALNLGFSQARGQVVVALDSDTLFAPDTVAQLCGPFRDPRVAAVAGNAKVGNRVNRLTRWQALEYVTAQNLERRAWDLASAVPVVPGAVGAWRRAAVLEAGGFHEDTLAEDTDLTLRLIAAGHRVVYAEKALAFTEAPETARALLKQRFRWTYGVLQACWKHKGRLFRPSGGVLGWLILPAFAIYQFLVPLVAPLVDLLLVLSLARGRLGETLGYYLLFFALDLLLSAVAVLLEGEDLGLLRGLFIQRILYRQLLWVALAKSLWSALAGFAVGWGKLARTGSVQAQGAPPPARSEPAPPRP